MNQAVFESKKTRSPSSGIGFFALIVLALTAGFFLRFTGIGDRPMHTDEAVNAYRIGKILEGEPFIYDSKDHHGPLYFALCGGLCRLAGSRNLATLTEEELRISALISSLLGIVFLLPYARVAGAPSAGFAALIWMIDPLNVYYGRYAIHETLFISLTLGFLVSILRCRVAQSDYWFCITGLCAGAMIATKESALLSFAAALVALVFLPRQPFKLPTLRKGVLLLLPASVVILLCFTWGFRNWSGLGEIFAAGRNAYLRAAGQGHEKPFLYFSELLLGMGSGAAITALAVAGGWLSWRGKIQGESGRFLSVYAPAVFLLYSIIPYKTPWLLLNIWLPLALLAAMALSFLWRRSHILGALAMILLGLLCSRDLGTHVFHHASDESNPLAYAHTSDDIRNLSHTMERLQSESSRPLRIAVMADDPWPLPWYLRRYSQVGYWRPGDILPEVDIVILDQKESERLQLESKGWRLSIFGERPGVLLLLYQRNGGAGR